MEGTKEADKKTESGFTRRRGWRVTSVTARLYIKWQYACSMSSFFHWSNACRCGVPYSEEARWFRADERFGVRGARADTSGKLLKSPVER